MPGSQLLEYLPCPSLNLYLCPNPILGAFFAWVFSHLCWGKSPLSSSLVLCQMAVSSPSHCLKGLGCDRNKYHCTWLLLKPQISPHQECRLGTFKSSLQPGTRPAVASWEANHLATFQSPLIPRTVSSFQSCFPHDCVINILLLHSLPGLLYSVP